MLLQAQERTLAAFPTEKESEWRGPFTFVQAADTQLGFMSLLDSGNGNEWSREVELTRRAVSRINQIRPKPRFLVLCGDMVNEHRDPEIRRRQVDDFLVAVSELDPEIPLLCVCGNHDVGYSPTPEKLDRYRKTFGEDFFVFWCGGVRFVVINSQYYIDPAAVKSDADEHDRWLNGVLNERAVRTVVCQHIPWFVHQVDEEEGTTSLALELRKPFLDRFQSAGVRAVFCGHYHSNAGGFYSPDLEIVVTSAVGAQLGSDKPGYRLVTVTQDQIRHQYLALDDETEE